MRRPRIPRARAWVALPLLLSAIASRPAVACSICLPGDPSFSSQGTSVQSPGSFSLYSEFRAWQKVSGTLHHAGVAPAPLAFEKNQSQRLDFYLGWAPLDRFSLSLNVPVVFNEVLELEGGAAERLRSSGVGDLSLLAAATLWRDRAVLPETWVEARALLKVPTGDSHEFGDAGGDPHVQQGTGSWDFGFGAAVAQRADLATFYASAFYRENTPGSLDYVYGDVALATLAAELPLGHTLGLPQLDFLVSGLAFDFRYAERDHFEGVTYVDSGGSIVYATPSLRIRLPWLRPEKPPSLRFAVQLPLTQQWLHGFQEEGRVWSAGVLVPF